LNQLKNPITIFVDEKPFDNDDSNDDAED